MSDVQLLEHCNYGKAHRVKLKRSILIKLNLVILTILLVYLYKFSIDPFLPVNVAFFHSPMEEQLLLGFYLFGKLLIEITGIRVEIVQIPIFLIPQVVLLISMIRLIIKANTTPATNTLIIFLGLLMISMFTEGVYIFVHHFGFILFLTFFLTLVLYQHTNNKSFPLLSIIVFFVLGIGGYKIIYLALLTVVWILILQLSLRKKSNFTYLLFVMIIFVLEFDEFLYKRAIPEFLIYANYGVEHGIMRFIESLFAQKPPELCFNSICFQMYLYKGPTIARIGHAFVWSFILFGAMYFVSISIKKVIHKQKLDNLSIILLALLISGSTLTLTYSILGLFHFAYSFLPSSIITLYLISQKISERKIKIVTFVLLVFIVSAYIGTISVIDQRFNPFSPYVKTAASSTQWASTVSESSQKVMADVFTRGFYTIYWNIGERMSGYPRWLKMEDLAEFYFGNSQSGKLYILNYRLPWWEMENWYKILPPVEYRKILHHNSYNLIYSSRELDIVIVY